MSTTAVLVCLLPVILIGVLHVRGECDSFQAMIKTDFDTQVLSSTYASNDGHDITCDQSAGNANEFNVKEDDVTFMTIYHIDDDPKAVFTEESHNNTVAVALGTANQIRICKDYVSGSDPCCNNEVDLDLEG